MSDSDSVEGLSAGTPLTRSDVVRLLTAEGEAQRRLFEQARAVRRAHGGDDVTLRGVIEISNFCQKRCDYCAMQCGNKGIPRYRMTPEDILAIAAEIRRANISTAFLQSGQDPHCDRILEEVIPRLKHDLGLKVLLCVGERPKRIYEWFAELGAESYILKFETSDPGMYERVAHASLAKRLDCLRWIREAGLKLGTGNIIGLPGQTLDGMVDDILLSLDMEPDFVSSSPFMPNQGTPLEHLPVGDLGLTLNTMAIARIAIKTPLIPSVSALEKIQKGGQLMGLNAGANVLTINFTPEVCRDKYAIYSRGRFVVSLEHALRTIEQAGLRVRQASA